MGRACDGTAGTGANSDRHEQVRARAAPPIDGRADPGRRSGDRWPARVRSPAIPRRGRASRSAFVLPVSSTMSDVPAARPLGSHGQMSPCALMAPTLALVLQKILIANRGEIAVRVIRAAREMGIPTVAVYSELDRDALHVRLADEAYALGGQTAAESYLNTEVILDVIERSGADCGAPRLRLLLARTPTSPGRSPPWASSSSARRPTAIDEMGDKVSSRARPRIRGGAPIVPGTTEFAKGRRRDHAPSATSSAGRSCIKAAFGGGGRGHEGRAERPTRSTTRWRAPSARPRRSSAATRSTSSGTSPGRATSRSSSSATSTATCVWISHA